MNRTKPILITRRCPRENCRAPLRIKVEHDGRHEAQCPGCKDTLVFQIDPTLHEQGIVQQCACCPGREFFVRKNFPQKLGMALVVIFGLIATVFFYQRNIAASFLTLGALVVIDAILYFFVGKVIVCYRCRAEYRGASYDSDIKGFDLATSEKYD